MSPPTGVSRCDCCSRHRPAGSRSRRRSRDRAETAPDSWEGKRGGVARDFCRPDREQQSCKHRVPRIGDEHGARGPRGSDLLCSPGVWVRGVPRLLLRAGSAVRTKAPRHCGSAAAPTRTVPISAESTWPAGVRLRSVGEALLGAVSSLAQAGSDDANHTAAASARTRGADRLPGRSLTGRACLIVVQAFPVGYVWGRQAGLGARGVLAE